MSKQKLQSRTIQFNIAMIVVETIHGSLALFQPMMTMEQFAIVSTLLGVIHGAGGYYLRTITTGPVE